jgi:hypothetical protein
MINTEVLRLERKQVEKLLEIVKQNRKNGSLMQKQRRFMYGLQLALHELLELKDFYEECDLSTETISDFSRVLKKAV